MLNQVNTFKVCYFRGKYVEQLQLRSELKEQTVVFILAQPNIASKLCVQWNWIALHSNFQKTRLD